ncbi:glycosyltransferase [Mycobacterium deserti]|uniref:4,4'-diaponeurosporenoate glycosyltransferase n=1 Tax=Mycobacterium deserti TaxID=2978347 RepID=A0ABT2M8P1_9MYCO|nr:glycosyltransferase [Mycobacterium deserti]MCT7657361.1 glycosyltransferase [Mycobacterium deserti]
MTSDGSIEVIIPARNMADHLPAILRPLLEQLTDRDRVTVADDASNDATGQVAGALGAKVVTVPESRGPYYARQVAASTSAAGILIFTDGRCRPLPGWLEAHRELQSRPGVALSCTNVRTISGQTLAARVAARQQPFHLRGMVGVPGRPDYFPTANLGIDRIAFEKVGGFRAMRSGGDADICWRIQEQSLGTMAADARVLMEWEPRTTLRELASQWKRYGGSTAYLEWVYGEYSPRPFGTDASLRIKLRAAMQQWRERFRGRPSEILAVAAMDGAFTYGYMAGKLKSREFAAPVPYEAGAG